MFTWAQAEVVVGKTSSSQLTNYIDTIDALPLGSDNRYAMGCVLKLCQWIYTAASQRDCWLALQEHARRKMSVWAFRCCLIIFWISASQTSSAGNKTMARVGVILHSENFLKRRPALFVHCAGAECTQLTWLILEPTGYGRNLDTVREFCSEGFDGMLSLVSCQQARVVDIIAEEYRIPHLVASWGPCDHTIRSQFTVPLDMTSVLPDIARDLALAAGWKRIGLAFGPSAGKVLKRRSVTELSKSGTEVHPFILNDDGTKNISRILETMPPNTVFILGEHNIMKALREQRPAVRSSWVILNDDVGIPDVLELIGASDMITAYLVRASNTACTPQQHCNGGEDRLMSELIKMGIRGQAAEGILLLRKTITRIKRQTATNQTRTRQQQSRISKSLRRLVPMQCFEVVRVHIFPTRSALTIGHWISGGGFQAQTAARTFGLLRSFDGRKLKIAVTGGDQPYVSRKAVNSYEGLTVDILSDLAFTLNFTWEYVEAPDGLYGSPEDTENGASWNGMIGMVIRGEVDLAIGTFTMTHQRAEVIDFTTAFMQQSVGILTQSPEKSPHLFQFLKPFSNRVWGVTIGLVLLSGITLWLMDRLTTSHCNKLKTQPRHFLDYAVLTVSSVFGQGPTFHPTTPSARSLLGFLLVFTMLVLAMYTAHLAAVLTVSAPVRPVDSLQDLDQRTDLTVLVEYGTSTWTLFEHSKQDLYKRINARKVQSRHLAKSLDLIRKGGNVFIGGRTSLQYWAATSCGRLRVADQRFFGSSYAFVLPKLSPYKDAINHRLLKMSEHGIIDSLVDKWLHPIGNCSGRSSSLEATSLRMDNLGGMFIVYGLIAALAGLILLTEIVYCKLIQFVAVKAITEVKNNR